MIHVTAQSTNSPSLKFRPTDGVNVNVIICRVAVENNESLAVWRQDRIATRVASRYSNVCWNLVDTRSTEVGSWKFDWACVFEMKDLLKSDYCAEMLRILADPERLLIIQCLRDGAKTVTEISAGTKEKIGNVSHHLKVLREAKIVEAEREGRFVRYRLVPDVLAPSTAGDADYLDIGCCRLEIPKRKR